MRKWTKKTAAADEPEHGLGLPADQRAMRERLLAAPVVPAPEPWRPVFGHAYGTPVGGLVGIGFASHPDDGRDLVMAVSHTGHGLFDAVTGERIARDHDPDPEDALPDEVSDLSCPGLGPIAGRRVRIAGLFGGGSRTTTEDGWTLQVAVPARPNERVLLSREGGSPSVGPHGERWWHIYHADFSELRTAGFSPSGQTVAVATSSDLALWTRRPAGGPVVHP
ncbi:hypothetical protein [Streptomyces sp. NPDC056628]|uniref:hypothetical protein n=1 Tax=Streptomyces sp. NPDC056628 TaxID=3345882 RepID=UPI0036AA208F